MPVATTDSPEIPLRVLVLDDEPTIRSVYETGLVQFGCHVETASNGREALQILMQHSFDVLIVDVRMEGMSGIVFLQEALKIWPWVGVIVVSGHVTGSVTRQANELGVTRILHKPVTLKQLHENVLQESEDKKHRYNDEVGANVLALMKDHLRLLSNPDRATVSTESLTNALLEFGKELASMLPSDVFGILVVEEGEQALLLTAQTPVTEGFATSVRAEMIERYGVIGGQDIDISQIKPQIYGEPLTPDGTASVGHTLSVPVILAHDVCGLLTLATGAENPYTRSDISLLYHAANHIAGVFMALRRMHQLATRDPLTNLFNRIRLEEELEQAWLMACRYDPAVSVVVIDVDHFKILNDTYGHSIGDEILRSLAGIMRHVARATDILARYGGDEFVAILPRADEEDARAFADRLLTSTREYIFCPNTHRLNIAISLGISTSNSAAPASSSAELLTQADRALYVAKRAGRNRISVWQGQGTEELHEGDGNEDADDTKDGELKTVANVIVVDDEPSILRLLAAMLEREGCNVSAFSSADEAIEAVKLKPGFYDIILTDISMPGKTGIELLSELSEADNLIVKIVMTGYATVDNAVSCLREGAYDFIQKPVESQHFQAVMNRAREYRSLKIENVRHQTQLERMVAQRSAQLAKSLEDVKASYEFTLEAFMAILDAREQHTGKHSLRVRELTIALARHMGIKGEDLLNVATGALLHDIGKIGIPDSILFHAGPLSTDEWDIMESHSQIGHRILASSPYLKEAARIVSEHHEKYDGSGYPAKLKGDEICLGARIFGVIDAYDAMRSERVYRGAMTPDLAAEEIRKNSGKQFDPRVVDAFDECRERLDSLFDRISSDADDPLTPRED